MDRNNQSRLLRAEYCTHTLSSTIECHIFAEHNILVDLTLIVLCVLNCGYPILLGSELATFCNMWKVHDWNNTAGSEDDITSTTLQIGVTRSKNKSYRI